MDQKQNKEEVFEVKGEFRIRLGMIAIIVSPILGVLLAYITCSVVGILVSDNSSENIVLVSSILAILAVGILEVVIGITEKNNSQDGGKND